MDDALTFVLAAALVITGLIVIVGTVQDAHDRHRNQRVRARHAEAVRMFRLHSAVCGKVPDLTQEEYHDAIQVLIRKYHMGSREGGLSLDDDTVGLAADRMTDTILQDRLTKAMLNTAELDLALKNQDKGGLHNAS